MKDIVAEAPRPDSRHSRRRSRVLHIAVETGSGVAAVIADHMASMPECDHHLLLSRDMTCQIGEHFEALATSVTELSAGHLSKIRQLRGTAETLQPDIVHAHSSFAGAYARIALPRRSQPRIVYSPHCFAFERTDVNRATRAAFWFVEAALSFRGGQVATCSPLETTKARSLPGRRDVTYVPNLGQAPEGRLEPNGTGAIVVSASGRIAPQKGPSLFAEAARMSRQTDQTTEWVWIGGGDPGEEAGLRSSGVVITGWLARDEAVRRLAGSHIYVHTAAWEGAPLTILEAAAAAVPIFARRTAAMEALGVEPLFESAEELVNLIRQFPTGPAITTAQRCGERLRNRHTRRAQREALEHVYSQVPMVESVGQL